jgi:glycolate oxidase iron-sulfur subunit
LETRLASWVQHSAEGEVADRILRACVHCGFCLATCPSYQVLGDELDSPRGRIYQIKQVLEGADPTPATQTHLDRCLTCRSCETTCPSGVQFGRLLDIGRAVVHERVARPWRERVFRWLLREGLTRRWIFGPALKLARLCSWALPQGVRTAVGRGRPAGNAPSREHRRKVLLLNGCTQPAMLPSIDAATARVLDAIGVQTLVVRTSGCCGAIRHHLDDPGGALGQAQRNIDAWWPYIEAGTIEAIVVNASGCGAMIKEYGRLLSGDARYAHKAARVAELTRDPVEVLAASLPTLKDRVAPRTARIAFQAPCTQQHALGIRGEVEALLGALGAELVPVAESHLCCGSAGTYSLTQTAISRNLRTRKLANLTDGAPQRLLSANIGCIAHLQSGTTLPVQHWIEWIDQALRPV